jgi:uncharacterized membrane protein
MKRSTLTLSILLVLSVSANLAVAGIMAGHWLRGGGPSGAGDRLLGLVPAPLRPDIHQAMRPRDPDMRAQIDALRRARREAAEAMRQRPFDTARTEAALAALRAETGHAQEKLHHTIVERMAAAQANGALPPPPARPGKGHPEGKPPNGPEPPPPAD